MDTSVGFSSKTGGSDNDDDEEVEDEDEKKWNEKTIEKLAKGSEEGEGERWVAEENSHYCLETIESLFPTL